MPTSIGPGIELGPGVTLVKSDLSYIDLLLVAGGAGGGVDNGGPGGIAGSGPNGGTGGSGVVIIRTLASGLANTGSPTIPNSGLYTIYKYTGSGTITLP